MALIALNWSAGTAADHPSSPGALPDALGAALDALPPGGRVTVMIHGYRFDPAHPRHDPHGHILSQTPRRGCWKAISWPRHLHLDRAPDHLGLAFGWPALGRLRVVAARAFEAGRGLGALIRAISRERPDLHVNILAHSLGARVALHALHHVPAGPMRRLILLSGAEYRETGRRAAETPAGRAARIVNIRSAENLPFDLAFRLCVPAPHLSALPLAAGLAGQDNWTDLRIDCPQARAGLRALGHRIPAPATRFCHWSGYLRPGLFPLYRRLLDPRDQRILPALAALGEAPGRIRRAGGPAMGLSPS